MNEMEKKVGALLGQKSGTDNGDRNWKAEFEALKAAYDHDKAMIGRVKASDARVKELEGELKRLRANKGAAEIAATITPEERGEIPDEYVGVAAKIASKATGDAIAEVNQEITRLREEREADRAAAQRREAAEFVERIDRRFPGFLASIDAGGDKHDAWESFKIYNYASINDALSKCDYKSLVYHIERFYREVLEVPPPNGDQGKASAPDPVSRGGGKPVPREDGKKTYTAEEYDALEKKCMDLRRKGEYAEYAKLRDELDEILVEGRVEER